MHDSIAFAHQQPAGMTVRLVIMILNLADLDPDREPPGALHQSYRVTTIRVKGAFYMTGYGKSEELEMSLFNRRSSLLIDGGDRKLPLSNSPGVHSP